MCGRSSGADANMRVSYSMAMRDQNRLAYEDDALFTKRVPEEHRPARRAYPSRMSRASVWPVRA